MIIIIIIWGAGKGGELACIGALAWVLNNLSINIKWCFCRKSSREFAAPLVFKRNCTEGWWWICLHGPQSQGFFLFLRIENNCDIFPLSDGWLYDYRCYDNCSHCFFTVVIMGNFVTLLFLNYCYYYFPPFSIADVRWLMLEYMKCQIIDWFEVSQF